eukprot:PITA_06720
METLAGGEGSAPPPLHTPNSDMEQHATPLTPFVAIPEAEQGGQRTHGKEILTAQNDAMNIEKEAHQKASSSQPKATSATCILKAAERIKGWIASKWKPKGQVTLQLGPKGFFTTIFHCMEDKAWIFEGGPYFFNSSGLYLTEWKPRFNPDKEDFSWAPVWIRMYSLPVEYWKEETLVDIGNKLGTFIKVAAETKTRK